MKKFIISLFFLILANLCFTQSLEEDKIYATQLVDKIYKSDYQSNIYLDSQLDTKVKILKGSTIHILESNKNNQVTRELSRISDSTFLYTEYFPMSCEDYIKMHTGFGVTKQGVLVISNETIIDSSVMPNPEVYESESYPSPRKRKILKPTGTWFEIYNHLDKNYRVEGSFNSNGKHGKWYYYTNRRELDKILTFENGTLIQEEFINILHYKSKEKTQKLLQRTWSRSSNSFTLNTRNLERSSTYSFESEGTFVETFKRYSSDPPTVIVKNGTWSVLDFETIELTVLNKTRVLKLVYVTDKKVRYQP